MLNSKAAFEPTFEVQPGEKLTFEAKPSEKGLFENLSLLGQDINEPNILDIKEPDIFEGVNLNDGCEATKTEPQNKVKN